MSVNGLVHIDDGSAILTVTDAVKNAAAIEKTY